MQPTISTENFEGPIELLLSLVEKKKLGINEVSLATVADEYLEKIQHMENVPHHMITHFLFVASTLVLLKSKSLLPTIELNQEETQSISDLERRVRLYQRIQELGGHVGALWQTTPLWRRPSIPRQVVFAPGNSLHAEHLVDHLRSVFTSAPKPEPQPQKVHVQKIIHIEEMMSSLKDRVATAVQTSFNVFTKRGKRSFANPQEIQQHKATVVVGFLAVLELIHKGLVLAKQESTFEDIVIGGRQS